MEILYLFAFVLFFIECMYKDFHLEFKVRKLKKTMTYSISVHQGDNLAPILFNIFEAYPHPLLAREQNQFPFFPLVPKQPPPQITTGKKSQKPNFSNVEKPICWWWNLSFQKLQRTKKARMLSSATSKDLAWQCTWEQTAHFKTQKPKQSTS